MLTQCPSCQTIFRITSEILRVAQGQVRCGRCHTQFDALERLIEEDEVEETGSGRFVRPESSESSIEVEEPPAQEDITLEGRRIEITGTYRALDDPDQQVRHEVTEEWVDLDEADEEFNAQTGTDGIEVVEEHQTDEVDGYIADEADTVAAEESEYQRFARRLAAQRQQSADDAATETELIELAGRRSGARSALIWSLLALPLVLLLLAQFVHHYRADLARNPSLGPSVVAAYGALGIKLTPDWQLHAYQVKQWGMLSDPAQPGTLKVRASITNRATFAQPYPLLRVVLEDRWGDQVRARDFEPSEYADPGTSTSRLMVPGQAINATITIVDPGPDAEGFRLDVCLRGKSGAVVCAGEIPR